MKKLIKKMKIINLKLRKLMLFTISDIIIYKNEKINKFKISKKKIKLQYEKILINSEIILKIFIK